MERVPKLSGLIMDREICVERSEVERREADCTMNKGMVLTRDEHVYTHHEYWRSVSRPSSLA